MRKAAPWIIVLAIALFVLGLRHLLMLRFASGDVYPPYSSLRADPLGVKAFYESLGRFREMERRYQPLAKLVPSPQTTLFYLGVIPSELRLTPAEFGALEAFMGNGGRLVITLHPSYVSPRVNPFLAGRGGRPGSQPGEAIAQDGALPITGRWGLEFDHVALKRDPAGIYASEPAYLVGDADLPPALSCHTSLVFTNLDSAWRVIYARNQELPVIVERPYRRGSLVICADSYHLSNEALVVERHSAWLSWLTGSSLKVIFDETHLGVLESPGIATLARQYRLHGLALALVALAGLFIWRNAGSFMPPYATTLDSRSGPVRIQGKDASAGFINLLRRHIPSSQLMKVCLEQWLAQQAGRAPVPAVKLARMQQLIDAENARTPRQRDPVKLYNALTELLARRPLTESRSGVHAAAAGNSPDDHPTTKNTHPNPT